MKDLDLVNSVLMEMGLEPESALADFHEASTAPPTIGDMKSFLHAMPSWASSHLDSHSITSASSGQALDVPTGKPAPIAAGMEPIEVDSDGSDEFANVAEMWSPVSPEYWGQSLEIDSKTQPQLSATLFEPPSAASMSGGLPNTRPSVLKKLTTSVIEKSGGVGTVKRRRQLQPSSESRIAMSAPGPLKPLLGDGIRKEGDVGTIMVSFARLCIACHEVGRCVFFHRTGCK